MDRLKSLTSTRCGHHYGRLPIEIVQRTNGLGPPLRNAEIISRISEISRISFTAEV